MRYTDPPVVEVALAASFQPIAGLTVVELGRVWDLFRSDFPRVAEQPPIEMAMEEFGAARTGPSVSWSLMSTPPPPRLWFLNEDDSELIQFQNNWFARNWRKTPGGRDYPRYPNLRVPFQEALEAFVRHAHDRKLGEFKPTQCEISYINHIPLGDARARDLGDVLSVLSFGPSGRPLPRPEYARLDLAYVIEADGEPVGRLHVSAEPAVQRTDNRPITVLTLTARGRPLGDGIGGVLRFLDLGHDWVLNGFDSLTTDTMQTAWGRSRA